MAPELWFAFVLTEGILCVTPGPAVLMIVATGMTRGLKASLWSNFGVLTANSLYFVLSAAGLGTVLLTSHTLFLVLKWVGAAYLVAIGVRALFASARIAEPEPRSTLPAGTAGRLFARGLALQLANPKSFVFFAALLPQFVDPAGGILVQFLILGLTSAAIEFLVLFAYGATAGRLGLMAAGPRFATWVGRVSGGMLIGAGIGIASIRRLSPVN